MISSCKGIYIFETALSGINACFNHHSKFDIDEHPLLVAAKSVVKLSAAIPNLIHNLSL